MDQAHQHLCGDPHSQNFPPGLLQLGSCQCYICLQKLSPVTSIWTPKNRAPGGKGLGITLKTNEVFVFQYLHSHVSLRQAFHTVLWGVGRPVMAPRRDLLVEGACPQMPGRAEATQTFKKRNTCSFLHLYHSPDGHPLRLPDLKFENMRYSSHSSWRKL